MVFYIIKHFFNRSDYKFGIIFGSFIYMMLINYYPTPLYSLFVLIDLFLAFIEFNYDKLKITSEIHSDYESKTDTKNEQPELHFPKKTDILIDDMLNHTFKNIGI